jgi:hypothetical protein
MELTLLTLSKLLKMEIMRDKVIGAPYLKLNDKYIITEHFVTKELEINNLETYEWQTLSNENITDYLILHSTGNIKE